MAEEITNVGRIQTTTEQASIRGVNTDADTVGPRDARTGESIVWSPNSLRLVMMFQDSTTACVFNRGNVPTSLSGNGATVPTAAFRGENQVTMRRLARWNPAAFTLFGKSYPQWQRVNIDVAYWIIWWERFGYVGDLHAGPPGCATLPETIERLVQDEIVVACPFFYPNFGDDDTVGIDYLNDQLDTLAVSHDIADIDPDYAALFLDDVYATSPDEESSIAMMLLTGACDSDGMVWFTPLELLRFAVLATTVGRHAWVDHWQAQIADLATRRSKSAIDIVVMRDFTGSGQFTIQQSGDNPTSANFHTDLVLDTARALSADFDVKVAITNFSDYNEYSFPDTEQLTAAP